jgi:transposase-like protein
MSQKVKKAKREFSEQFKKSAVARMSKCASVVGLAKELGIHWSLLYKWKKKMRKAPPPSGEQKLQAKIDRLEAELGVKTMEISFLEQALQKIQDRPASAGGTFTTKSGK